MRKQTVQTENTRANIQSQHFRDAVAGTKSNMKRAIVVARKAEDAEINLIMLLFRRGDGDI